MTRSSYQPRIRDEDAGSNREHQAIFSLTPNRKRRSHSVGVSRPQYNTSPTKNYPTPTTALSFDTQVSPLFQNLRMPESEPDYHDVDERRVHHSRSFSPSETKIKTTPSRELYDEKSSTYRSSRKKSADKMKERMDLLLMFNDELETNSIMSGLSGQKLMNHNSNNATIENQTNYDKKYEKKRKTKNRDSIRAASSGASKRYVEEETIATTPGLTKSCSVPLQIPTQRLKSEQSSWRRNRSIMKTFFRSGDVDRQSNQVPYKPTEELSNPPEKRWTRVTQRRRRIEDFPFLCGKMTSPDPDEENSPVFPPEKNPNVPTNKLKCEADLSTDQVRSFTPQTTDLSPDKNVDYNMSLLLKVGSNDSFENDKIFTDKPSQCTNNASNIKIAPTGVIKEGSTESKASNSQSKSAIRKRFNRQPQHTHQKLDTPLNREISIKLKVRSDHKIEHNSSTDFTPKWEDASQEMNASPNCVVDLKFPTNIDNISSENAKSNFVDSLMSSAKSEQSTIILHSEDNSPKSILRNRPRQVSEFGTYPLCHLKNVLNSGKAAAQRKTKARFSDDVREKIFIHDEEKVQCDTEPYNDQRALLRKDQDSNTFFYEELRDIEHQHSDDVGDEEESDLLGSALIGSITSDRSDQKSDLVVSEDEMQASTPNQRPNTKVGKKTLNLRVPARQFDPRNLGVESALSLGKTGSYLRTDNRSHSLYDATSPPKHENDRYDAKILPASSSFSDGSHWTNDEDYDITDNEFDKVANNLDKTFEKDADEELEESIVVTPHNDVSGNPVADKEWDYYDEGYHNAVNKEKESKCPSTSQDENITINDEALTHNYFIQMVAAVVIQTLVRRFLAVLKLRRLSIKQLPSKTIRRGNLVAATREISNLLTHSSNNFRIMTEEKTSSRETSDRDRESHRYLKKLSSQDQQLIKRDQRAATDIQRVYRGWWVRDTLQVDTFCATIIQRAIRGFLAKLEFHFDMYRIILVQSVVRMVLVQKDTRKLFSSVGGKRRRNPTIMSRKLNLARYAASVKIQAFWRSYLAQERYLDTLADVLILQSLARRWIANTTIIPKLTQPEKRNVIESYRNSRVVQHFSKTQKKLGTIYSGYVEKTDLRNSSNSPSIESTQASSCDSTEAFFTESKTKLHQAHFRAEKAVNHTSKILPLDGRKN